ncbi:fructose-bisphosphate aldolase, class II [Clostridium sp. USBA 49]|uniref:class II fructose-bisphosphate aldolase n=1 Tax=Clostridium sp. USBA 49 TaxID=1881060 RepID=UPI000999EDF3|nr:class II fructose-bisphosphate aldolase [Clostridium sp. USBA 49]SKA79168.1 fructose-bisphosphate aldolase, class II [Clostridium sp. USBA 49]
MLVNLNYLLKEAQNKKTAVAAFNTPSLEAVRAAISAAEELSVPVIIQHAQVHEEIVNIEIIGKIMLEMAKNSKVDVCVHLDHGTNINLINKAIDMGFTSVMFDGSNLPYEENIICTSQIVQEAHKRGISVEAELGVMSTSNYGEKLIDDSNFNKDDIYTDPELAFDFVKRTGIDALAASFGTVHGLYLTKPNLDFKRLKNIYDKTMVPIVMHGGSGVSREDYHKSIENGVRKINYYTYAARAAGEAIRKKIKESNDPIFYHDITLLAMEAMKQDMMYALKIFNNMD